MYKAFGCLGLLISCYTAHHIEIITEATNFLT